MANNTFKITTNLLPIYVVGYDNLLDMINRLENNGYKVIKVERV